MDLFARFAGIGVTSLREGGFRINMPGFTTTVSTPDKVQKTIAELPLNILMTTAYLRVNLTYNQATGAMNTAVTLQTALMHCLAPIKTTLSYALLALTILKTPLGATEPSQFQLGDLPFDTGMATVEGNTEIGDPQNVQWGGTAILKLPEQELEFTLPVMVACSLAMPEE